MRDFFFFFIEKYVVLALSTDRQSKTGDRKSHIFFQIIYCDTQPQIIVIMIITFPYSTEIEFAIKKDPSQKDCQHDRKQTG